MKKIIIFAILMFIPFGQVLANGVDHDITLDMIEIEQYALPYTDHLFIDQAKLQILIKNLKKKVYVPPENATLNDQGEIVSEKAGISLDVRQFQTLFREYFYRSEKGQLHVPVAPVYPQVDSELLANINVQELGTYVTYFKKDNEERTHNISLAAQAINNYILFPKETFSFNKVVGERTKGKGYKRAPVIVKGELAEDIGGGICQVSSTLFNAVDLRGVQIVERYAHSRSVPYVPPNRDATVSWWGPDFAFKNLYNQPLLIRAQSINGKMVVKVYSSEDVRYLSDESDES